jgi:indole-3-glycerol phosphate synthase
MILDDILRAKREDLDRVRAATPVTSLKDRPLFAESRRPFLAALQASPRAIIAEVKKASPSKGVIRAEFDPVLIAERYAECGAAAISVLTEERFFQGHIDFMAKIRARVPCPLLRKDFLFDAYQLYEARAFGADAVLLIVAALDDASLRELLSLARELEMEALVEVHDADELARADASGARIVGINNRDLRTFETTLATTEALSSEATKAAVLVSESGIENRSDIERLERVGVRAFLVGEALMRAPDPGVKLQELLGRRSA